MSTEETQKREPTVRFFLRCGSMLECEDDSIEDVNDVIARLDANRGGFVQFGDGFVHHNAINGGDLL